MEAIALTWTAPAACPDKAAVAARIERLLGGPARGADRRLDAVATVEAIRRGFRLEITLSAGGSASTRVLQGTICESVADAAALVIALAFDPEAVAAQEMKQAGSGGDGSPDSAPPDSAPPADSGPPAPSTSAAPTDSAAPPPPPGPSAVVRIPVPFRPPPPDVPAPPPSLLSYGAFAQFAGDAGSLPSVAPGVRAGLSLGIGAYRLEPAFEAWPSSKSALPDRADAGADLRLLAFSLDACRRLWPWESPSELGISAVLGCVGFEIGEMHGAGFGVATPRSGGALWTAPRAGVRAELSLARSVALTLDLGLAVPMDRRNFVLSLAAGRTVVHEPATVSGRAGAGIAVRF